MKEKFIQKNNAVINVDDDTYNEYISARKRLQVEKYEKDSVQTRLSNLENELAIIKQKLKQLIQ